MSSSYSLLHPRPLVRSAEAGGFGLVDGGGVEFAVGGGYDGFGAALVEREAVDFLTAQSVYVALDHWVVAGGFCVILPVAQSDGYFYKRLRLVL